MKDAARSFSRLLHGGFGLALGCGIAAGRAFFLRLKSAAGITRHPIVRLGEGTTPCAGALNGK